MFALFFCFICFFFRLFLMVSFYFLLNKSDTTVLVTRVYYFRHICYQFLSRMLLFRRRMLLFSSHMLLFWSHVLLFWSHLLLIWWHMTVLVTKRARERNIMQLSISPPHPTPPPPFPLPRPHPLALENTLSPTPVSIEAESNRSTLWHRRESKRKKWTWSCRSPQSTLVFQLSAKTNVGWKHSVDKLRGCERLKWLFSRTRWDRWTDEVMRA